MADGGTIITASGHPAPARLFGGAGGVPFDDEVVHGDLVAALWLASGTWVDSIQIAYRDGRRTSRHGGTGGTGAWIPLAPDERIVALGGRCGAYVEQLLIRTTHRTILAGDPEASGTPFLDTAPEGQHVTGFRGRFGRYLDAVGALFAPPPPPPHPPEELAREALCRMPEVRFVKLSPEQLRALC